MHIKFINRGTGSAGKAVKYITSQQNSKNEKREEVSVLRGDPNLVAGVADSLDFKHKYTSCVIAFAPEDNPNQNQINNVLNEFEKTAFSGLDPERYCWTAVLHREKTGGCHIHTLTARVDLETGKSLNIAPPGHQKTYDALRDYFNYTNGWARPDDPERQRLIQPGHNAYIDAEKLRAGVKTEPNPRELITQYLTERIESGQIENRLDIINSLNEVGFTITRQGKNYITVQDQDQGQRWRLKGAIYEKGFERTEFEGTIAKENSERQERDRGVDRERASVAWRQLEACRKGRAEYNQERYRDRSRGDERSSKESIRQYRSNHSSYDAEDRSATKVNNKLIMDKADSDKHYSRDESLSRHLSRKLGIDAISIKQNSEQPEKNRGTYKDDQAQSTSSINSKELGDSVQQEPEREIYSTTDRDRDRGGDLDDRYWDKSTKTKGEIKNDRVRDIVNRASKEANENNRKLGEADGAVNRACKRIDSSIRQSVSNLQRHGENFLNEELERFKKEINLVEFAATKGFYIDNSKSSRNTTIMRRNDRSEKIAIGVNKNGHYVFNDLYASKGGTILDFSMREGAQNLGFARKELRTCSNMPKPELKYRKYAKPAIKLSKEEQALILKKDKKACRPLKNTQYLESREIRLSTIQDDRFKNRICQDSNGNICFPHSNAAGFSGCEKKNKDYTNFTKDGSRGVWYSNPPKNCDKIVICESAIDSLSYAQLHSDGKAAYISIAGQLSHDQEDILKNIIERNQGKDIVLAFDNDKAGKNYVKDIQELVPDANVIVDLPRGKEQDWNDVLKENQKNIQHSFTKVKDRELEM